MEKKTFLKKHPISFDNYYFKLMILYPRVSIYDNLRSLTFYTAFIISNLEYKFDCRIDEWIFSGGGIKNIILMNHLKDLILTGKVSNTDEFGYDAILLNHKHLLLYL